jgi:hypothetical protein
MDLKGLESYGRSIIRMKMMKKVSIPVVSEITKITELQEKEK